MTRIYEGVVKDNTIMLDSSVELPEGAKVEVRVHSDAPVGAAEAAQQDDPFEALLKRRAAYEGRHINVDELIEEEKQDREERFDHWLFPKP